MLFYMNSHTDLLLSKSSFIVSKQLFHLSSVAWVIVCALIFLREDHGTCLFIIYFTVYFSKIFLHVSGFYSFKKILSMDGKNHHNIVK